MGQTKNVRGAGNSRSHADFVQYREPLDQRWRSHLQVRHARPTTTDRTAPMTAKEAVRTIMGPDQPSVP